MKYVKTVSLIIIIILLLLFVQKAFYALLIGFIFSFLMDGRAIQYHKISKFLIQLSVITMAFKISIDELIDHSLKGFYLTAILVFITIVLGFLIGKILKLKQNRSLLISAGTAICGASAIAAVSQSVDAEDSDISISLTVIFLFNALALMIFPYFGSYLSLDQNLYGLWAALAIHDTSSVLAAGRDYGDISLEVATIIKLTRTLWIIPLMLIFSVRKKTGKKISLPYFIFIFIACLLLQNQLDTTSKNYIVHAGKYGFTLSLFFIGLSFDLKKIKRTDYKSFILGLFLWLTISIVSLILIINHVI